MRYWCLILLLSATAWAQSPMVVQKGQAWERSAASEPVRVASQTKRVELFTRGNVTVRGSDDNFVRVKVRQRVRATTADAAARIWGPLQSPRISAPNPFALRVELYLPTMRSESEIEISLPRHIPAVVVSNQYGSLQIYDFDGGVRAETGGGHVTMDRIRGNVFAHTGLGDVNLGEIGGAVICSSGGGTVTLASAAGEANCATGGGDITVKSVGGPLLVSTEGGNIRVEKAGDTVRAKSMAGIVTVDQARGAVFADSGGGSVHVRAGSGPLSVSTMLGDILAELIATGRFADSSLMSGSGDITVTIPANLGLAIRARNDMGQTPRIVSDFPEVQTKSVNFRSPLVAQGTINGGGPILDLNANGTIYLRRAKCCLAK